MGNIQQLKALAKINLGLDVLGRREEGYHNVRMVMQTIYCMIISQYGGRRNRVSHWNRIYIFCRTMKGILHIKRQNY